MSLIANDIIPLIDLTLLDTDATAADINALAIKASHYKVAAICALPEHIDYVSPEIDVKRATVINFPTGTLPHRLVLKTIEETLATKHVDEIDYVFPYQAYLAGNKKESLADYQEVLKLCKEGNYTFKVILETGALPSNDVIYQLSTALIDSDCDFLKTSTGKIAQGATIQAVLSMLSAIVDNHSPCGIKVSGGIKTVEQALCYMQLTQDMLHRKLDSSFFRIGASSLLDILIQSD